jgi:hypothetical protein
MWDWSGLVLCFVQQRVVSPSTFSSRETPSVRPSADQDVWKNKISIGKDSEKKKKKKKKEQKTLEKKKN